MTPGHFCRQKQSEKCLQDSWTVKVKLEMVGDESKGPKNWSLALFYR